MLDMSYIEKMRADAERRQKEIEEMAKQERIIYANSLLLNRMMCKSPEELELMDRLAKSAYDNGQKFVNNMRKSEELRKESHRLTSELEALMARI